VTNGKISSYRDLKVWQFAIERSVVCYEVTRTFPREEIYGMTSQIRTNCSTDATKLERCWDRLSEAFSTGKLTNSECNEN
jgi:hypothetical protein